MSIPSRYIDDLLQQLESMRISNLVSQNDARRILRETKEMARNYPKFDNRLTEKVCQLSYILISCGCSILENSEQEVDKQRGLDVLEKAGKCLGDAYQYVEDTSVDVQYQLLISGMALYIAKQFSRAFIILKNVELDFSVGAMICAFIRKDMKETMAIADKVFFNFDKKEGYSDEKIIEYVLARSVFLLVDYINTGTQQSINEAIDDLTDLQELASINQYSLYWLIIRLFKLVIISYKESALWNILPPLLLDSKILFSYISVLRRFKNPIIELWPSQVKAIRLAIADDRGCVINLKTSAGKTRVAEISILQALSRYPQKKILYLAPFRSLAFEVERTLEQVFGPLGFGVTHLYGGAITSGLDLSNIENSDIIITTPEKAKALFRYDGELKQTISLYVMDEGHLIGSEPRLIKNELFYTQLKKYAKENNAKVILLSAVLPNANELALWISDDENNVIRSDWKPSLERLGILHWTGEFVNLEWKSKEKLFNLRFIVPQKLEKHLKRKSLFPHNKREAVAATALKLSANGTVMIFSARANSIEGIAKDVLLAMEEAPSYNWDTETWEVFKKVCVEELGENSIVFLAAEKGIICHNNKLPSLVRISIEKLIKVTSPKIIIASSTLGQGVNINVSTVIISTPYMSQDHISNRDFWNICGRAGRAFTDCEGKILYVLDHTEDEKTVNKNQKLMKFYFNQNKLEAVESGLIFLMKSIIDQSKELKIPFESFIEMLADDALLNSEETYQKIEHFFDLIDDQLLLLTNESTTDNVDAIEDFFRNSLLFIQASENERDEYLKILKARVICLKKRIGDPNERQRIIQTNVPISIALLIQKDQAMFEELAQKLLVSSSNDGIYEIESIEYAVSKIDTWCVEKKIAIEYIPSINELSLVRDDWLSGKALKLIKNKCDSADRVIKQYYEFSLPWIIHAIAQTLSENELISKVFDELAILVEKGVPTINAANVIAAGVYSRTSAISISQIGQFDTGNIADIKNKLRVMKDTDLSDSDKQWIDIIKTDYKKTHPSILKFRKVLIKGDGIPKILTIHYFKDNVILASVNGEFVLKTKFSVPYQGIEDTSLYYFQKEDDNDIWKIISVGETNLTN